MKIYEIDATIHILIHGQEGKDERDALLGALDDGNYEIIGDSIHRVDYEEEDEE